MKIGILQPRLWRGDSQKNVASIKRLIDRHLSSLKKTDICVLPECCFRSLDSQGYENASREIQKKLKTALIAGSHHEKLGNRIFNRGLVLDHHGKILAHYGKLHPFGDEIKKSVRPYSQISEFKLGQASCAVFICADFFFSDLFLRLKNQPDIIFVVAESVASSTNDSSYGRALWRYSAIARAYEFGAYVIVCDWARSEEARTCGASGFADPTTEKEKLFYRNLGVGEGVLIVEADFKELKLHRHLRRAHHFFWRPLNKLSTNC